MCTFKNDGKRLLLLFVFLDILRSYHPSGLSNNSCLFMADNNESSDNDKKHIFTKELKCMMYGFGDDQNPYTETVDALEDIVIKFITETTKKALDIGRPGRVQVEDIVFIIRKDPRKFARVKDL